MSSPQQPGHESDERPAAGQPPMSQPPKVRQLGPVPVFDCRLYVRGPDEAGGYHVRCANLPEISSTGKTEREAIGKAVEAFKKAVHAYTASQQAIPFVAAPEPANPDERPRWVPVHL